MASILHCQPIFSSVCTVSKIRSTDFGIIPVKQILVVAPGNTKALMTIKRLAPTSVQQEDFNSRTKLAKVSEKCGNVKPKMPKPKTPDWDYKTPFNVLSEKHQILVNSHKEAQEKLNDLAIMEEDHNRSTSEVVRLTKKLHEYR